jgi:HEAT repeat protein
MPRLGTRGGWVLVLVAAAIAATLSQSAPANPHQAGPSSGPANAADEAEKREPSKPDYHEEAWRVLWLGLHNPRTSKRVEAVKALSLMTGNQRALVFALRALNDKNFQVRAAAATTLGSLHEKSTAPALRAALSDKQVSVMLAAAHALYVLHDPAAYEIYYAILMGDKKTSSGLIQEQINRLKDPKQVVEMGFQEGLGFVPYGGMGYEAYRTLMKRGNASARVAAARFLASDPDPISEDALMQAALVDKSIPVREAALDALAEKNDPRTIERLETNLHQRLYAVRYRTAAVILNLSGKTGGTKQP